MMQEEKSWHRDGGGGEKRNKKRGRGEERMMVETMTRGGCVSVYIYNKEDLFGPDKQRGWVHYAPVEVLSMIILEGGCKMSKEGNRVRPRRRSVDSASGLLFSPYQAPG